MTGPIHLLIPPELAGERVDKALAQCLAQHSRAAIQRWLSAGAVRVDGHPVEQTFRLRGGEQVEITAAPPAPALRSAAQPMAIDIVHQDPHLLVLNKPPDVVVHPGAGRADHTLLNGLLHLDPALGALPRAGIVHRLDKGTSGLLVVARTEAARLHLVAQLNARTMGRRYLAVVSGVMVAGERIEQPIGRHRQDRLRMAVTAGGRAAATRVRVERKFRAHCLLGATLESGRTHQIRVHLSWRGFPLVGDTRYGARPHPPRGCTPELQETLRHFPRPALHATELSLVHPASGETCSWHRPMPTDLRRLVEQLEEDRRREG